MGPAWIAAILAGILAAAAPWLERLRPLSIGERTASEVHVTSGGDRGIGSLREAIFLADRADRRVRILIQVPLIRLGELFRQITDAPAPLPTPDRRRNTP